MKQYRQGEILLVEVKVLPKGRLHQSKKAKSVLLGIGETGNAHTLVATDVSWLTQAIDDINVLDTEGAKGVDTDVFVVVPQGGRIEHNDAQEGHESIVVDEGTYQVHIKQEQFPGERRARFIND